MCYLTRTTGVLTTKQAGRTSRERHAMPEIGSAGDLEFVYVFAAKRCLHCRQVWDDQLEKLRSGCSKRVRWWDDDTTKRHINNIVGRSNSAEVHFAFHHRIAKILEGKKGLKALSVGCGVGTKEIWLMQMIDVERFDLSTFPLQT